MKAEGSRRKNPILLLDVPDTELCLSNLKVDTSSFAFLRKDLFKSTEDLGRFIVRGREFNVSLDNFGAVNVASVFDRQGCRDRTILCRKLEIRVLESNIGQAESKLELGLNALGIEPAVASRNIRTM